MGGGAEIEALPFVTQLAEVTTTLIHWQRSTSEICRLRSLFKTDYFIGRLVILLPYYEFHIDLQMQKCNAICADTKHSSLSLLPIAFIPYALA
jgi:hypothetical protein